MNWFPTSCLLALGVFMGSAIVPKLRKPVLFSAALAAYGLPPRAARAITLPAIAVEALSALLLLLTRWPRLAGVVEIGLLVVYSSFIVSALMRGTTGQSCGCFTFGHDRPVSWTLLVRNGLAAILAAVPVFMNGSATTWVEWILAVIAACFWLCALALVDELGVLYELMLG